MPDRYGARMDLVASLRTFSAVAHERSFTRGAERCGQPQPVASRRVAALERHLGVSLLRRSSRRVDLTPDGERLLEVADEVLAGVERIERLFGDAAGLVVAVPEGVGARARAAIRRGLPDVRVAFAVAEPAARADALRDGSAHLALLPAAPDASELVVALGVAHVEQHPATTFRLGELRRPVRRRDLPPRSVHLLVEDDVPAVRDPLQAAAFAAGLRADQVRLGTPADEAWTRVHEWDDVVLTTAADARREDVAWAPLSGPGLARGYRLHGDGLAPEQHAALVRRLADGLGGTVVRGAA